MAKNVNCLLFIRMLPCICTCTYIIKRNTWGSRVSWAPSVVTPNYEAVESVHLTQRVFSSTQVLVITMMNPVLLCPCSSSSSLLSMADSSCKINDLFDWEGFLEPDFFFLVPPREYRKWKKTLQSINVLSTWRIVKLLFHFFLSDVLIYNAIGSRISGLNNELEGSKEFYVSQTQCRR